MVIRDAADDLDYKFIDYVFSDAKFPWGFLDQGRVIKRCLFPVKVTTTFYDAKYNVVTQADQPGRYGAVVRIALTGGIEQFRFITLYRTPEKVYWSDGATPATVSPADTAGHRIDPVVLQKQATEIGDAVNWGFSETATSRPISRSFWPGWQRRPGRSTRGRPDQRGGPRRRLVVRPAPAPGSGEALSPSRRSAAGLRCRSRQTLAVDSFTCTAACSSGRNLQAVRVSGLAGLIAQGKQVPAVVVSPQCPAGDRGTCGSSGCFSTRLPRNIASIPIAFISPAPAPGGDAVFDLATATRNDSRPSRRLPAMAIPRTPRGSRICRSGIFRA